jgi:hypothetical protein
MATLMGLTGLAGLDPAVNARLQEHLMNVHLHQAAPILELGTMKQLSLEPEIEESLQFQMELGAATKISQSEKVDLCFDRNEGAASSYPELPKRTYLVACMDDPMDKRVFAVYSLEQMRSLQTPSSPAHGKSIKWRVLEISEKTEDFLCWQASKALSQEYSFFNASTMADHISDEKAQQDAHRFIKGVRNSFSTIDGIFPYG